MTLVGKLDNFLYGLVHDYVYTRIKLLAKDEVRRHVIQDWKDWKGGGNYGQRRESQKQNAANSQRH